MPDCNTCEKKRPDVPWEVHQDAMARANLANRRMFWAWAVTFILLLATVVYTIWQHSQYELVEQEYTQEIETGEGEISGTIINRGGVFYYGEDSANDTYEKIPQENGR